jgi:hypothetical protein
MKHAPKESSPTITLHISPDIPTPDLGYREQGSRARGGGHHRPGQGDCASDRCAAHPPGDREVGCAGQAPGRRIAPEPSARTGPQPVKVVRLNRRARQGQSGGFRDGSTSIFSKLCSNVLMQIHKPCACAARQSSIRSARSRPAWIALSVLAYNLTRVMNIVGIKPLIATIAAETPLGSRLSEPTSFKIAFTRPRPTADLHAEAPRQSKL